MPPKISHHLLLCATSQKGSCCDPNEGIETWEKLKSLLQKLNLEDPTSSKGIVLRSKVDCLRICKEGPILLIWPDGIWYQRVSPTRIELIVKKHVLEGTPIKEWVIKETPMQLMTTLSGRESH